MLKLCEIARKTFLDVGLKDPISARNYSLEQIEHLCRRFESSEETKKCMREVLRYVSKGDIDHIYVDRPRLRIQPSDCNVDKLSDKKYSFGRFSRTLPVHRDTWGSGISYQINWWGPLFELDRRRTLQIYPSYFKKAVPNTSSSWDYEELKKCRRSSNEKDAYPQMPVFQGNDSWYKKI